MVKFEMRLYLPVHHERPRNDPPQFPKPDRMPRTPFALCLTAVALLLLAQGATAEKGFAPPTLTMRVYDERVQRGVDLIYNLRFEEADRYFDDLVASYPDNPLGYFFRAMVAWWRVLIDLDDTSHDEAFYRRIEECIEICDARLRVDADDFDAILFKGGAIGFRGRLRGDRRQMLRAARDGLRCLPLLERSRSMEPTNKDILFGQGIYNYFREVIPQKYPIVRAVTWMLEDGDRETGLRQLREVAAGGRYARAEAKYFLAQIYRLFEEEEAEALPYLEELRSRYPANSIFHRYTARTYASLNRWERAIPLYREVVERSEAGARGYHRRAHIEALYYQGYFAFIRNRLAEVVPPLAAADSLSRGLGERPEDQEVGGYVALSNLFLGMALDGLGRREEAMARYARVRELPGHGNSHELAAGHEAKPYRLPQ